MYFVLIRLFTKIYCSPPITLHAFFLFSGAKGFPIVDVVKHTLYDVGYAVERKSPVEKLALCFLKIFSVYKMYLKTCFAHSFFALTLLPFFPSVLFPTRIF